MAAGPGDEALWEMVLTADAAEIGAGCLPCLGCWLAEADVEAVPKWVFVCQGLPAGAAVWGARTAGVPISQVGPQVRVVIIRWDFPLGVTSQGMRLAAENQEWIVIAVSGIAREEEP